MGFGAPFAQKARKAEPVRPVTGTLVRIVLLAVLAVGGAAWGMYLYYTHAFRAKTRPSASENFIEIDLNAMPSAAPSASASAPR